MGTGVGLPASVIHSNMDNGMNEEKRRAAEEKAKGNKFFGEHNYRQAIEHYSKVLRIM